MVSGDRREYDVCRSCQENTQRRECQLSIWECSLLIPWSNTSDTSWSFYPTPRILHVFYLTPRILPNPSIQLFGYFLITLSNSLDTSNQYTSNTSWSPFNTLDTSWSLYPRIHLDLGEVHLGYFLNPLSNILAAYFLIPGSNNPAGYLIIGLFNWSGYSCQKPVPWFLMLINQPRPRQS